MATKITARTLKFAKVQGEWINLNLVSSIEDNGDDSLIYFQDRNIDNVPFIEIKGLNPDEVIKEILHSLNGEAPEKDISQKEQEQEDDEESGLDDFLESF